MTTTDHTCPELFRLTVLANGMVDLAVCWDQIDVPGITEKLRDVLAELEGMPSDATGRGVVSLLYREQDAT